MVLCEMHENPDGKIPSLDGSKLVVKNKFGLKITQNLYQN